MSELREIIVKALEGLKGKEIVTLDVYHMTDLMDYMIIVSGYSNRQVRSLAESVLSCAKDIGVSFVRVEGLDNAEWTLVDLGDVVVHIMLPGVRRFYDLERLWGDEVSLLQHP